MNFQPGDLIFFKKAKKETHRRAAEGAFKGHGFGVMLGHVPPFGKDPEPFMCVRLMGSIGYVSFDDIGEFLGNEIGAKVLAMFEAKYYAAEKALEAAAEEPSKLILPPEKETPKIINIKGEPFEVVSESNKDPIQ